MQERARDGEGEKSAQTTQTTPPVVASTAGSFAELTALVMAKMEEHSRAQEARIQELLRTALQERAVGVLAAAGGAGRVLVAEMKDVVAREGGQEVSTERRGGQGAAARPPSASPPAAAPSVRQIAVRQLSEEEQMAELSRHRHEGDMSYRIGRQARVTKVCSDDAECLKRGMAKVEKIDLVCTAERHTTNPCRKRRTVCRDPDTHEVVCVVDSGAHSAHSPPQKRRTDPDVIARVFDKFEGSKPAAVEAMLVREARKELDVPGDAPADLAASRTMTRKQVSQVRSYKKRKENPFPASEVLANVATLYGAHLVLCNVMPARYLLMSPWQRENVSKAEILFIDTTFKKAAGKHLLTVLLARAPLPYEVVHYPLAFYIHQYKSEEEYSRMLTEINLSAKAPPKPVHVLRDFDNAIRLAVDKAWNLRSLGDLFHFLSDNRKWIWKNIPGASKERVALLMEELRAVALLRHVEEFRSQCSEWKIRWEREFPTYMEYFEEQWEKRVRTNEWALWARSPSVPTGDQAIEAYNSRLDSHVFAGRSELELNELCKALVDESNYWRDTLSSPELMARLTREKLARVALRPDSINVVAQRELDARAAAAAAAPPQPPVAQDGALVGTSAVLLGPDELLQQHGVYANPVADMPGRLPDLPPVALRLLKMKRECILTCGRTAHGACRELRCRRCCIARTGDCSIADHNRARLDNPIFKAFVPQLDRLALGGTLWMRYRKAPDPRTSACFDPEWYVIRQLAWGKVGVEFSALRTKMALPHLPEVRHNFLVVRIFELSAEPPANAALPVSMH